MRVIFEFFFLVLRAYYFLEISESPLIATQQLGLMLLLLLLFIITTDAVAVAAAVGVAVSLDSFDGAGIIFISLFWPHNTMYNPHTIKAAPSILSIENIYKATNVKSYIIMDFIYIIGQLKVENDLVHGIAILHWKQQWGDFNKCQWVLGRGSVQFCR